MKAPSLVLVLLAAAAAVASAQAPPPLATVPANPVAGVPFEVQVTLAACYSLGGVTVNGSNVDVTIVFHNPCIATPPFFRESITAGPLPVGNYTLRLVSDTGQFGATLPLVVSADVPALDWRALAALAVTMAVVAVARVR